MITRRIRDVMTSDVVTVTEDARFAEIVRLMAAHRISALPVLNADGRVVGIVSEADLLRKEEYQDDEDGQHWLEGRGRRAARAKASGRTAAGLMSAPVVTVSLQATIPVAAKLLARRRVKRLPVVDDQGGLVGIVSRADLLRLFLRADEAIRAEIEKEVLLRALWVEPGSVTVAVRDGIVTLTGHLERKSLVPIAVHLTRTVPGVVDVAAQLTYELDDDRIEVPRTRTSIL